MAFQSPALNIRDNERQDRLVLICHAQKPIFVAIILLCGQTCGRLLFRADYDKGKTNCFLATVPRNGEKILKREKTEAQ